MIKKTCDRCGVKHEDLNTLALLRSKPDKFGIGSKTVTFEFELCNDCARKVFAFIGEEVK